MVGRDAAIDDALAEAPGGVDEHDLAVAAHRVECEGDAGGFGWHECLDDDGHGGRLV